MPTQPTKQQNPTQAQANKMPKTSNTQQQQQKALKPAPKLAEANALTNVGIQPPQPLAINLPGDPKKEYAAGGTENVWLSSYARALPPYIDDLTLDFGPDLYVRMLRDAQV